MTKIMVVDDHEVVRCGLRRLVEGTDIEVGAEATTGAEAVRLSQTTDCDVVLLDIRLPEGDGLDTLYRIKQERPTLPILMFSTFDNPTYVARAVALGAQG